MNNDEKLELIESVLESHHIVPAYKCKELGLTTSYKVDGDEYYFKENCLYKIPKKDHALIHWGYYNNDLKPLFKYVKPEQWVIDLIPIGDYRDGFSGQYIGLGVIDEIVPLSGKEHPSYKHGNLAGERYDPKIRSAYQAGQRKKPGFSEQRKAWDENWRNSPKGKAYNSNYDKKARAKISAKEKLERYGEAKLDAFFE